MMICEGGGGGQFGDHLTFSGLLVYRVDLTAGFERLGGIPHGPEGAVDSAVSCNNWWMAGNSEVKRSIFMDDYVYSVARERINVSRLGDLEHPVASIALDG